MRNIWLNVSVPVGINNSFEMLFFRKHFIEEVESCQTMYNVRAHIWLDKMADEEAFRKLILSTIGSWQI